MAASPQSYKVLFDALEPEDVQKRFLTVLLECQGVERGSIWIRDAETGYRCIEAAGLESETVLGARLTPEQPSLVKWVLEHNQMTIAEAGKDQRHFQAFEVGLRIKSRLILCYPLVLRNGEVYGVLELIDTSAHGKRLNLDPAYLTTLREVVDLGAVALSNALAHQSKLEENGSLREALQALRRQDSLIGHSEEFLEVVRTAQTYARTDFPVLITGESGTGKELLAQEIHRASPRAAQPFLVQNCSAIPETLLESELFGYCKGAFSGAERNKPGLFQAANGGTIFLDEIGDMAPNLQARILRVLQNHEVKPLGGTTTIKVDIRIVSATNCDLAQAVEAGRFRQDLLYRLNVLPLVLPPLRRRQADIPLLAMFFLARESRRLQRSAPRLSALALQTLCLHTWPGNVRELENIIKYVLTVVPGALIDAVDLPLAATAASPLPDCLPPPNSGNQALDVTNYRWEELERLYVHQLLDLHKWSVTRAATAAGVNRSTFTSRMRRLGVNR